MVVHLDDFAPKQRFKGTSRIRMDDARMKSFAAEFDPQPFRTDNAAAATVRLPVGIEFDPASAACMSRGRTRQRPAAGNLHPERHG